MPLRNRPESELPGAPDAALWEAWTADCTALGLTLDPGMRERLERLHTLLMAANRTVNLTRLTEPADYWYRHVLDSLTVLTVLGDARTLADVGSGAGFPALPLAIVRPDLQITAIEATGKKCQFIEQAARELGLENVTVRHARSEEVGRDPACRERFDAAVARAVATLPVLLELCLPLVKPGGRFLAMKGEGAEAELAQAARALQVLKAAHVATRVFERPALQRGRILVFRKDGSTPPAYPRTPGLPGKKPL